MFQNLSGLATATGSPTKKVKNQDKKALIPAMLTFSAYTPRVMRTNDRTGAYFDDRLGQASEILKKRLAQSTRIETAVFAHQGWFEQCFFFFEKRFLSSAQAISNQPTTLKRRSIFHHTSEFKVRKNCHRTKPWPLTIEGLLL